MSDQDMKVYIARHKSDGRPWYGNRKIYSSKGAIKSAMKTSWGGGNDRHLEYDIYEYELTNGKVVE